MKIKTLWGMALLCAVHLVFAGKGPFFEVISTGDSTVVNANLCLDARSSLGCQNYKLTGQVHSIRSLVPNHTYPKAGIKVNTPNYSLNGCTLSASGYCMFTASPSQPQTIHLVSTSSMTLSPTSLPNSNTAEEYNQTITATGGVAPYQFTLSSGTLPPGLTLSTSGIISGRATQAGTYSFTITATDAQTTSPKTGSQQYTVNVINATSTLLTNPSPNPSVYGETVTFTADVTPNNATGTITFVDGGTPMGNGTVTGGVAIYTSSTLTAGTHSVVATYNGTSSFASSTSIPVSQTVNKANQATLVAEATPTTIAYNETSTLSSSGGSGAGAVTYTVTSGESNCSISGTTLTGIGTGSCTITATKAADDNYNTITSAAISITITPATQSITFTSNAPDNATVGGTTYTPITTTSSDLTVQITVNATSSSVCSISGGVVSFQAIGTCLLDANQPGNANYDAAPQVQQSFTVGKGAQTITYTSTAPTNATVGGATYTPTATASSGLTVQITVDATSSSVCSISGGVVSFQAVGTCLLDANQAGNANYDAASEVQQSFTVGQGAQTITYTSTAPTNATVGGAMYTPTATASSGLSVQITVNATSSSVCSISGGIVSFQAVGTCLLDANQQGNANYDAAPQVQQSFTVGQGAQTITYTSTAPTNATVGGTTYTPTATASSGLNVQITVDSSSSSVCSISSGVVSFQAAGTCTLDANQPGNANYDAASEVQQSFTVGQGAQTITYTSTAPTNATVSGATYTPTATTSSGLSVQITVDASSSSVCSISGGVVSFQAVGTCLLDANQPGNANYDAAPQVQQSFTVGQGAQTITYISTAPTSATVGGTTYTPTATVSSGLAVQITVDASSSSICSISAGVVSFQAVGTCLLDANQAGNANYDAAPQVQQSFTVGQGAQTITYTSTAPISATVGGTTYTPTATASSGLAVQITVNATSSSVCSISGGIVSFQAVGTCFLDANQPGNANYDAASEVQQSFTVGQGAQTITYTSTAPTNATVSGATYTLTATASSGLTVQVTVDASSSSVCSISGGVVSFQAVGTCLLDANQAGNANYDAAPQVQQSFTVGQGAQTITYTSTAPTNATVGGTTYTPTATASSGLAVQLTVDSSSSSVCSISGGVVSFQAVGTCLLEANQAGNANYDAASEVQQSFTVGQGAQTITYTSTAPTSATVGGTTYTPAATASSGLSVQITVDSSSSSVCSISSGVVSFQAVGTCLLDANQAGNANYDAASEVQQSFTVGQGAQTITYTSTAPTSATVGGGTYTPTATASSGLSVQITVDESSSSVCSISGGVVSFQAVGTCLLDTNQAGNANYDAAPQVQQSFTVGQGAQTITYTSTAPTNATVGGATYTPTATVSSGLTVQITVDATSSSVCSISGGVVSFQAVGTCLLDANQAGNANYDAASEVQQSFTVGQGAQTITYTSTAPTNATVGGTTYTPTATASSGLAVQITVNATSSSVCSISGGVVSFQAIGTCLLDANQAGNANYDAASEVQQSFTVGQGDQTITYTSTAPSNATVGGTTYTPTATASSGLSVQITVDSSSSSVCAISSGVVSFQAVGTCTLDANQPGNANYDAATQVQQSFTVGQGAQTITYTSTAPTNATVGGATYTPTATASSDLNVQLTVDSSSSSVCSISGGVVSFQAAGTCLLDANQAGNANYDAASEVQQSFTVGKGAQTITYTSTAPSNATVGGTTYTPTATASSGLTVQITVDASSSSVCSISGGVVSFQAVGTCLLDANQAGNANYDAASEVQQSFTVGKGAQTITYTSTAPTSATVGGTTYTPTAIASSGLAVQITVDASSSSICSISAGVVSFQAVGTCLLDANQPGNANYEAASEVQQSFTVGQGAQTITYTSTAPTSATVGGATYTPTATASSGLAVQITVDVSSSSVCSVSGGVVSFQAVGTCLLDANQAGNANYDAASEVQQSFTVAKESQTITFTSTLPSYAPVGGATYTPSATASSGLTVQFTVDGSSSSICTISSGVVSFIAAGTCLIDANQPGNANYSAAPQVQQSINATTPPTLYVGTSDNNVAYSTNGGYTWTPVTSPDNSVVNNVFINGTTVYAGTVDGNVKVSTNNGTSWTATTQPNGSAVNSIFVNGTTLYAATSNGTIETSTSGGTSWTATTQPDGSAVNSVFINGTTLYAGTADGNVEISTNGGSSWTPTTQPDGSAVNSVFVSGTTLYAATQAGNVEVSTNGGISWTPTAQPSQTSSPVNSVFVNGTTVYATTGENMLALPSGASSWTTTTSPDNSTVKTVFANSTTLYATTGNAIAISTNGGTTWTTTSEPDGTNVHKISVSGTTIYAVTQGGNLEVSTNGGTTWTAITLPSGDSPTAVFVNGTTLYAITSYNSQVLNTQFLISNNGGLTWTATPNPPFTSAPNRPLVSLFVYETTFYVTQEITGPIAYSTNGGTSWTQFSSVTCPADGFGTATGNGFYVISNEVIYASCKLGVVSTTNGGTSWSLTPATPEGTNSFGIFISGTTIYVGLSNGYVGLSTNGGTSWTTTPTPPASVNVAGVIVSNFAL